MDLRVAPYETQRPQWPEVGETVLAQWGERGVVVYQAYCHETADYALAHGTLGGARFSRERMTWVKPGFLWMMFRSGWATKPGQERVLALTVSRLFFDGLLRDASLASAPKAGRAGPPPDVVVQWDPDHNPRGTPLKRRAIQLGVRGRRLEAYLEGSILSIEDLTPFVHEQHAHVLAGALDRLVTPVETPYTPATG